MNEHIKNATDYAFDNNVADMQTELESALQYKIINALEQQKIEMAQTLMNAGVSESHEKKLKGDQVKLDVAEPKGKLTAADFKKLRKEEEELDEKLTASMPASKVIQDFVHSDDPKFKGKSKKERIKMALGAFYGMHPEKSTKNEELELSEGSGPYELHDPKHPKFKANYEKFKKSNPDKNLSDFVQSMKANKLRKEESESVEEDFSDVVKGIKRKIAGKTDPKEVQDMYGRIARSAIKYKTKDQAKKDIDRYRRVTKVVNKEELELSEGSGPKEKQRTPYIPLEKRSREGREILKTRQAEFEQEKKAKAAFKIGKKK